LVRSGQPGTAAVIPDDLDGVNAIDILIASPNPDQVNRKYLCTFFNPNYSPNNFKEKRAIA